MICMAAGKASPKPVWLLNVPLCEFFTLEHKGRGRCVGQAGMDEATQQLLERMVLRLS